MLTVRGCTAVPWKTPLHRDTPVASEQFPQPRDADRLEQEQWKCPMSTVSKSFRSFSGQLSHLVWVTSSNMHHRRPGRAASASEARQQAALYRITNKVFLLIIFVVQEGRRAELFHRALNRSQPAPSLPHSHSAEPSRPRAQAC